jgi:uncharacterized protein YndB with AHSA1/START domain
MKILKIIGIALLSIVGLVLIIAAFLPSEFTVTRSVEIIKPVDSVYAVVADFGQFPKWNPWAEKEKAALPFTVTGMAGTVGNAYAWVGTETGVGSMTITAVEPGKSITQDLVFTAPFQSASVVTWTFESSANGTKATWSNNGKSLYPMGRIFGVMMDKMIGPDFEKGLSNLKTLMEKSN